MRPVQTFASSLLFVTALGLCACTVGPDYRPPEISMVAKEPFREAAATGVNSAARAHLSGGSSIRILRCRA
jgi:hypothetical protein